MNITKGNTVYIVTELKTKWKIAKNGEKLSLAVEVPKDICKTEDELKEYVLSSDLF